MPSSLRPGAQPWPTYRHWTLALAAAGAGFSGSAWLAPQLAMPVLAAYVVGFVCVVTAVLGVVLCTPRPSRTAGVPLTAAILLLALPRALGVEGASLAFAVLLALLAVGSLVGTAVGARIEHPGHLLFVALISSFADTFSVAHPNGPSAVIAKSTAALSVLALPWPMLASSRVEAFLGVGDVVFTALYVGAARAHGLSLRRTAVALALAFLFSMSLVMWIELPVPVLPFLGLSMLIAHPAARLPPARDRARGLAVTCALCTLFAGLLAWRLL